MELADAAEGEARRRAALARAEAGLTLSNGIDRSGRRARTGELKAIELSLTPEWRKNAATFVEEGAQRQGDAGLRTYAPEPLAEVDRIADAFS